MNCTEDVLEYWMGRVTAALDLDQEKLIDRLSISDQVHCFLFCQALQAQALDAIHHPDGESRPAAA
jgi:hypothetical protein